MSAPEISPAQRAEERREAGAALEKLPLGELLLA